MDVSATAIGHRIYEVRRALGPDARHELPQRAFATLLNQKAAELYPDAEQRQADYDSSVITRLERGERRLTVQDIVVVAAADPRGLGVAWLVWGDAGDPTVRVATPSLEELAEMTGGRVSRPRPVEELFDPPPGHEKAAPSGAAKKRRPGSR